LQGKIKPPYISLTDLSHRDFEKMTLRRAERTRAYVKIEDGCDSKCPYCAIKNARGRVRSKPPAEVISEVEALYRGGTREIVLTGIETAAYGRDFGNGYNLASLIRELSERGSCERIRLGSLAPELIGRDFTEGVRGVKILAPHFHLSIQSGSDNVLFRMKRRYSRNQLLLNIKLLKEAFPDATFTTDLMVGFPGETDADFELTLSLVREIGLLSAHVFIFSKREGTEAYSYTDTVSPAVAKRRSEALISECNRVRDEILSDIVNKGESLSVIAETYDGVGYLSHSDTFVEVYFKSDCKNLQGEMLSVRPVSHKDGVIYAEI
jgi:threonylcarbamoyladenosine tRNA methylthiotransferase MtaB